VVQLAFVTKVVVDARDVDVRLFAYLANRGGAESLIRENGPRFKKDPPACGVSGRRIKISWGHRNLELSLYL
jgi:hypothetical protein